MRKQSKTRNRIRRICREMDYQGYLSHEDALKMEELCIDSILNLDEVGPVLAKVMSEIEQKTFFFLHGIMLCNDEERSGFTASIPCQKFEEFYGIVREDFNLPIFYSTHENIPVYRVLDDFEHICKLYFEEMFLHERIENEMEEFSFYFPSMELKNIQENENIKREYLRKFIKRYIELKEEKKEESILFK